MEVTQRKNTGSSIHERASVAMGSSGLALELYLANMSFRYICSDREWKVNWLSF